MEVILNAVRGTRCLVRSSGVAPVSARVHGYREVLDLLLGLPDDAVLEGGVALLLACSRGARRR